MATTQLRQAARKLSGDRSMQMVARRRQFHSTQVNHGAARGREEEALTVIRDKEELYSVIAEARRNKYRIGWWNRGLLWCLPATARRSHNLAQKHVADVQPYKAESDLSKLTVFAAMTALLLLSHWARDKVEDPHKSSKAGALGDAAKTAT